MTQLLSLLNHAFGYPSNSQDLEQYISAHNPASEKDVEALTQDYLYHFTTVRGL